MVVKVLVGSGLNCPIRTLKIYFNLRTIEDRSFMLVESTKSPSASAKTLHVDASPPKNMCLSVHMSN